VTSGRATSCPTGERGRRPSYTNCTIIIINRHITINTISIMIKKIWNKITTFLSGYYSEHKDDIIIGFVIATVVGILFKTTVATWFMSLWITLAYQIITCGIQAARKKTVTGLKIHPIIINFVVGVFISLLFLVWQ
jgi:hypothetical protein